MSNILFYNGADGSAATGTLDHGQFVSGDAFPPGYYSPGWTHIVTLPSLTLFYRATTGEGAVVSGQATKFYSPDGFARDWTHVVFSPANYGLILFYNAATGTGAIVEAFDNNPIPGGFSVPNDIRTLVGLGAGSFTTGWTNIVETPDGKLLFYNANNGAGALGTMDRQGFQTLRSYPPGSFSQGWTHIVTAGTSMLFYNSADRSGAIGFDPTVQSFPAGSFGSWTLVALQGDPPAV
jgi:hypothetical protein